MSHILITYSADTPTVSLVMELITSFSQQIRANIQKIECGQITGQHILWADCLLVIRPYDKCSFNIIKAAKKYKRFVILYLDDDLLHAPNLYTSLPRKIVAQLLKKRNRKALRASLYLCDTLWVSNPLLLNHYKKYVHNGRCIKCDVITDISRMKAFHKTESCPRLLFAGSGDHAELLNKYIIPALNELADTFPDLEMTCIGITRFQLDSCKIKIKFIPWISNYDHYRSVVENEDCDIGIAVIEESEFYQCKYFNKFIEYSLLGIIGIYTDSPPYNLVVQNLKTGLLAKSTSSSWAQKISYALKNSKVRESCVGNAQDYIKREFSRDKLLNQLYKAIPELYEYQSNKNIKIYYHKNHIWNLIRRIGTILIEEYELIVAKAGQINEQKN